MKVIAHDPFMDKASVTVPFFDGQSLTFDIEIQTKEAVLKQADFLSLHFPAQKDFVIGTAELELMKDGAGLVNAARGGVVDEVAMVEACLLYTSPSPRD